MSRPAVAARSVYGIAALTFGAIALACHDFNPWQPAGGMSDPLLRQVLLATTAIAQIGGGLALQMRRTSDLGAWALLAVYALFALLHVPSIVAHPLAFTTWGGLFEEVSLVAAALLLLRRGRFERVGLLLFSVCIAAFMLYQALYIPQTAALVPKWIPLGQTFWAIATTAAFGLAALAFIVRRSDVLAARLLTLMFSIFQLSIWLPPLVAHVHSHLLWAANAQNLAIAASSCIVAVHLARVRPGCNTTGSAKA